MLEPKDFSLQESDIKTSTGLLMQYRERLRIERIRALDAAGSFTSGSYGG